MSTSVPEGLFHCAECAETYLDVECPACSRSEFAPPWLLTSDGWKQPRIDGTLWVQDPSNATFAVPDRTGQFPGSTRIHEPGDGHIYRHTADVSCPACTQSESASQREEEPDHSALALATAAPETTESQHLPTQIPRSRSGNTGAWVAAGLVVAFFALLFLDAEYDFGIFDHNTGEVAEAADGAFGKGDSVQATQPSTAQVASQPTLTTPLDPDAGWETGACVNESAGGMVSLVSCARPHDGEIVSTVSFESLCPDRTTHSVDLDRGVACLVLDWADGFSAEHCSFNGLPLYGSVYLAEQGDSYDVMVAVTENSYFADLEVAAVDYSFGANGCGLWHIVDNPYEADFTVAATDSDFLADFTIAVVENEWQAGT